ncbi:hypothetical protein ACS0TY_023393 [Phlomoides rotata]
MGFQLPLLYRESEFEGIVFCGGFPRDQPWPAIRSNWLGYPTREYFEYSRSGELEETAIHHDCFTKGLSPMDHSTTDDNEPPCMRPNCEGIWIDKEKIDIR